MKKRLMALVLCLTVMMTMFAPLANATEEDLLSTPTPAPAAATVEPQAESAHESAAPTEAHTEQPSAQPAETVGQPAETAAPAETAVPAATAQPAETAASPVEEDVSGMIAVTAGSDVNLRTAPGRDSESLGKIAQSGTAVKPLKKVTLPGGEVWYAVEYEGHTGYIFGDLLALSAAPAAAETPAAAATPETQETPAPVITEPDAVYTYEFSNTTSEVIYGYEATATLGQSVSVPRNGRVVLSGPAGQWQILVGGVWADLAGADSGVALTYALLKNAGSSTRIRCLDAAGNSQGESAVTLTEAVSVAAPAQEPVLKKTPLRAAPAAVADVNAGEGEQDTPAPSTYTIIINYRFANGNQAAPSWSAQVATGSAYTQDIQSPTVVGYTPDYPVVHVDTSEAQTYTVTYQPAEVDFTVKHYQQNVSNDQYTLVDTETKTGYTESAVGDSLKKSYEGFTALLYDATTKIAADGSTVVEISYDRNYYLLTLNLDGGYGADPVYARYGAPISVADPTKPGYTFGGWNPSLPATMPAGDKTCTAQWTAGNATYLVQYWLENANDDGYSYDTFVKKTANVGNTVSGSGDKSYTGFRFDHADQNVTVKGDGTSVVNVYYKRNTYTLTFKVNEGFIFDNWVTKAEFKNVKYGEDTTKYWNQAPSGYLWYTGANSSTFYTAAPDMPNNNLTIYGKKSNGSSTIHYYEKGTTTSIKADLKVNIRDWSLTEEDYIAIPGFTFSSSQKSGSNYYIYYTRNSYKLDFNNRGTVVKSETVLYEKELSSYNFTPEYPSELEPGAYQFDGWYTDPGFTVAVDWTTAKMSYHNTIFYAKWVPVKHKVTTWLTSEKTTPVNVGESNEQTIDHGKTATEPEKPTNGNYTFVGWFYQENGVEKAFDFSMPITKDLDLYAKWSSNKLVEYTIKYAVKNADDTFTYIAEDTKASALAGSTKTFEAKTGTQLNEGYQTGYFPEVSSHSLVMDINGNNEYTFIYVQKEKVPYTVRYLEKDTNKVLHAEKNAETSNAVITEKFEQVAGYAPDAYQKRLVLAAEGNEIIFWYTKDETHAPVQIIHWTQNIEGDGYTEYQSSTNVNGEIGTEYSETSLTLAGFTYNADKSNSSGTLTAAGLVLNLYYDRNQYPYEFRFLEQGTNKVLAEPVTGSARYQAQVTQTAKNIPGYTLVSANQQAINIAIEDPANEAAKNVKIFYYVEQTVEIKYEVIGPEGCGRLDNYLEAQLKVKTGTVKGSMPTAADGYRFVGWFKDEAGTQPVDSAWVEVENNKITPKQSKNLGNDIGQIMVFEAATYYAKFVKLVGNVTVKKLVTGNLGDETKDFKFVATYTVNGESKSEQFYLKHDKTWTLANIPVGTVVTITEDEYSGYTTTNDKGEGGGVATITVVEGENSVTFTNNKNAVPDTGVLLDSLPYVVILAVVVLGAALVIVRRRKHRDDD